MKYIAKAAGVTLLEVLLVLAIGAVIIVMSIRYYQSASIAQQVNMTMEEIQAITAAADSLAIGTGSYLASTSQTAITALVGSANMVPPTGSNITFTPQPATRYQVTIPVNNAICVSVVAKLAAIPKIPQATVGACGTVVTYTYDNTQ